MILLPLFPAPPAVSLPAPRCAACARPLRAAGSRAAGLGPVCAARLAPRPSHGGHMPPPVGPVDGQEPLPTPDTCTPA
ncbi:DUF6011 domain-containing protein [Streptomyces lonarensis]|uniref:DUF6011 domain-containing protein n=1 Tax=Streptomyces lonarensis TaxID=700599 RepID=UPI0028AC9BC7|nr:DUF6011 domain-containing protein [Streptomyces lonarensis]